MMTQTRCRLSLVLGLLLCACLPLAAQSPVGIDTDEFLVRMTARAVDGPVLKLALPDGTVVVAERERSFRNPSGSVSWVGRVRGETGGRVTLVSREGVTVGSIRVGGTAYGLRPVGGAGGLARLQRVALGAGALDEDPPTEIWLPTASTVPATHATATGDKVVHDLLVVYTPRARDEAGGTVAVENLIDLGVTETNLSYEASGIHQRLRLAHAELIDYDEFQLFDYGPRDRLQIPDDGHMDEVHPLRDRYRADLVMLLMGNGGGCGRAFIMAEVSPAFEAYAFAVVNWVCVSPGYTFQHELGHLMGGRHQWSGDTNDNAPFSFNHGYLDSQHSFRTIMAGNDLDTCGHCPRRLAWSNPDRLDPATGAPMGVPEGEPMACDNRKTLNATAQTIAAFRDGGDLLADDFESGDLSAWSASVP